MNRILALLTSLLILGSASLTPAGPKEDVAAATQAWIDAMSSHDPERVVALYDPEAVLSGTRSPTLRDNPAAVRDWRSCQDLPSVQQLQSVDLHTTCVSRPATVPTGRS